MIVRGLGFSGEMVRAILDGRKTQTRRVVKPQPRPDGPGWVYDGHFVYSEAAVATNLAYAAREAGRCPYGKPGDRLWVRETWAHDCPHCEDHRCGNPEHVWYRANEKPDVAITFAGTARWRPSIHMPRWASRITLEITDMRVQRVQEISYEDCAAEGIDATLMFRWTTVEPFRELWDSLNAKRGYGWDANPWVWVLKFRRLI